MRRPIPRLHVLTPPELRPGSAAAVEAIVRDGIAIQVRVKGHDDRDVLDHARTLVTRAHARGATCLVNDRLDLALAAAADGVHLGAGDLPVADARRLADACAPVGGPPVLVGGTAREPEAARRLVDAGADYLGVGPCYATASKSGLPAPGGPARVEAVVRAVDVPVIAIGGVTVDRVPALLAAGAHGVAVIGAVWSAPDPAAAVSALCATLEGRP